MKTLFFMLKVKGYPQFERAVRSIIKANLSTVQPVNHSTFFCYIKGDIFRISTGAKVQDFDFSHFNSEEEICNYIAKAIELLRAAIPLPLEGVPEGRGRLLLDDYTETISLLR